MAEGPIVHLDLADIKRRLAMRQWTSGGDRTWPVGAEPPAANWLACVTVVDVERLIAEVERLVAEVERLQWMVVDLQEERDEGLVLVARLARFVLYGEASEYLGITPVRVLQREREAAELGAALVRSRAEKQEEVGGA